ncbi:MAG: hypothetical protein GY869_04800, partial [Planctomycetes bacterium]|nr:hypothetical protein [Planctomycetota bacterium]
MTAASITITGCPVSTIDVSGSGEIQDAVDAISASGTINVTAGTYSEDLAISKALSLIGKKADGTTDAWTVATTGYSAGPTLSYDGANTTMFQLGAAAVTVKGFKFDSNNAATHAILSNGANSGSTIEYCTFEMNGTNSDQAISSGANSFTNLTVNYCDFDGSQDGGNNLWFTIDQGSASTIAISNNTISQSSSQLELGAAGNITGITYSNNTITNANGAILLDVNGTPANTFGLIDIRNNTFQNSTKTNRYALRISSNAADNDAADWSDIIISQNDFVQTTGVTGAYVGFEDAAATSPSANIDARNNYWGSSSGPDYVGNTFNTHVQGDSISPNVDFVPWWSSQSSGTGYAPIINNDSPPDSFASFTAAIAGTDASGRIKAEYGIFRETFTIGKTLTFLG